MRQLLFLILSCCFFACTNDEQDMKYGEEQVLNDTEWIGIQEYYYSSDKSLSPVEFPKDQIIYFTGDSFTITTKTTVYDKDLQTTRDSVILTNGKYLYKHPSLYLNTDSISVEAWVSPLNHICFYDNDVFREFEKND